MRPSTGNAVHPVCLSVSLSQACRSLTRSFTVSLSAVLVCVSSLICLSSAYKTTVYINYCNFMVNVLTVNLLIFLRILSAVWGLWVQHLWTADCRITHMISKCRQHRCSCKSSFMAIRTRRSSQVSHQWQDTDRQSDTPARCTTEVMASSSRSDLNRQQWFCCRSRRCNSGGHREMVWSSPPCHAGKHSDHRNDVAFMGARRHGQRGHLPLEMLKCFFCC